MICCYRVINVAERRKKIDNGNRLELFPGLSSQNFTLTRMTDSTLWDISDSCLFHGINWVSSGSFLFGMNNLKLKRMYNNSEKSLKNKMLDFNQISNLFYFHFHARLKAINSVNSASSLDKKYMFSSQNLYFFSISYSQRELDVCLQASMDFEDVWYNDSIAMPPATAANGLWSRRLLWDWRFVLLSKELQEAWAASVATPGFRRGGRIPWSILWRWTSLLLGRNQSRLLVFVHFESTINEREGCARFIHFKWKNDWFTRFTRSRSNYWGPNDWLGPSGHGNIHERSLRWCRRCHPSKF